MEEENSQQDQVHDILFSRKIGWQDIIYDLINTEQLDPWNINITTLTDKYLEKIKELEEQDFFVSSKVLLAASLLLRIKSEILLNKYIKSIDEILFGKKEEEKQDYTNEKIELEEEIPQLIPKSPMPRFKKVTLNELMDSLNKAITTENRRIKKEVTDKNVLREASFSLPKRKFNPKTKSKEIHEKILNLLKQDNKVTKISFTNLTNEDKEEKVISFLMLLHLEHQRKIWVEQGEHFGEIFVWPREIYFKHNPDPFADLREEN